MAIDTALRAPERVEALVLVAPAVSGAPEPSFEGELIREMEQAEQAILWLDGPSCPERVGEPLRSLFLEMNRLALAGKAPPEEPPPAAWPRLEELAMPVRLLTRCEELAGRISGAELTVWPDVAHLPLEQPERFVRWLSSPGAPAPS